MARDASAVPTVAFNHGPRICTWEAWYGGAHMPMQNAWNTPLVQVESPSCGRPVSSGRGTPSMAGVLASKAAFMAAHNGIETNETLHPHVRELAPVFADTMADLELRRAMAGLSLEEALRQMGLAPGQAVGRPVVLTK